MDSQKINFNLKGIGTILADKNLSVPLYQRSYAWEKKNVEDLFLDLGAAIKTNIDTEYFLGSIVLVNPNNEFEVVDGQQRLATTTILLAAFRDYFFKQKDTESYLDIENKYLFVRNRRSKEVVPRLKLNEVDRDFFLKYILSLPNDPDRKTKPLRDSHKKIADAALIAKRYIENIVKSTSGPRDSILDWLDFIDEKIVVIKVVVPNDSDAFAIFETLNDRGLDLALSDLLKNYLFRLSGDRIDEAKNNWTLMYGSLEAVAKETIVKTYIRHLWSSKNGLTREKELYEQIKKNTTSKQGAIDFTVDLAEGAKIYAAFINTNSDTWNKYTDKARKCVETLNTLQITQVRPLLLSILKKFPASEANKALPLIISWTVRFLITGKIGGGTIEDNYSELAKNVENETIKTAADLRKDSVMTRLVPPDKEFEEAFATVSVSKSFLARYYLSVLENQNKNEPAPELITNTNTDVVNLEHILPEHPSSDWSYISPEDCQTYYNRLGNLTLMKSKPNSDIGNKSFAVKLEEYKKSEHSLTKELEGKTVWNISDIEERQRKLAVLAVKAWSLKLS